MFDDLHYIWSVLGILFEASATNISDVILASFYSRRNKEIFISDWSRTPRWSRWDSPTSWRVDRRLAVDSGLSGRERASDACPRRVLCHRRALSPWCRSPIHRPCYRIRYQFRCHLWWFPAPSRTASLCKYVVSRVRSSVFWRVQNRSISLRLPSLGRCYWHGCLCGLYCARASGLKPEIKEKEIWRVVFSFNNYCCIFYFTKIVKLYHWYRYSKGQIDK